MMYNETEKIAAHIFSRAYFLCVIINELVVGSTTNSPYLRQTLVETALSSHCVEESPANNTPSHLSLWQEKSTSWAAEETSKEEHYR